MRGAIGGKRRLTESDKNIDAGTIIAQPIDVNTAYSHAPCQPQQYPRHATSGMCTTPYAAKTAFITPRSHRNVRSYTIWQPSLPSTRALVAQWLEQPLRKSSNSGRSEVRFFAGANSLFAFFYPLLPHLFDSVLIRYPAAPPFYFYASSANLPSFARLCDGLLQ